MTLMHYAKCSIVREMNFGASSTHIGAKLNELTVVMSAIAHQYR
jgi:hypothetical protein